MKTRINVKVWALVMLIAALLPTVMKAQDFTNKDTLRYVDAMHYRLINWAFDRTLKSRIPLEFYGNVRPTLWDRASCTSGKAIRFATNSTAVAVRYNLLTNMHMMHMADTGIKGTLDGKMHEYMIYLPLYDGVRWIEIGVDSSAVIMQPMLDSPREGKKFIFYGTSIMQGGCACRPGMVATSIIQRDLDVECVNLGFSGEGKMDSCMAQAMAAIPDVAAYILDPIPNCTKDMCDTVTYGFVNILRTLRPEVPIFMVEGQMYSYAKYSAFYSEYLPAKNNEYHKNYLKLKQDNPNNLYYITCKDLYGPNNEGTVDGIHLTDIGFWWYAQKLEPYLRAVLDGTPIPQEPGVDDPR